MFNEFRKELKEDIQKQLNESQENMAKKLEKAQTQLNEFKEDFKQIPKGN
jgi:predicted nuclease with TOPRIM domain